MYATSLLYSFSTIVASISPSFQLGFPLHHLGFPSSTSFSCCQDYDCSSPSSSGSHHTPDCHALISCKEDLGYVFSHNQDLFAPFCMQQPDYPLCHSQGFLFFSLQGLGDRLLHSGRLSGLCPTEITLSISLLN